MPKGVYPRPPHRCNKCGETDTSKFYGLLRTECIECTKKRTSKYQTGNKEFNRRRHLRRAYGLTPEKYDAELAKQNGLCAVCGKPPDPTDLQKNLVVDHDHTTKNFRGLVHGRCNAILGYAKDDPSILLAAVAYLNRYNKVLD